MTRDQVLQELAAIALAQKRSDRGGVARTKESELQLAAMRTRKAELEAALATAPTAEQMAPQVRELEALQAELGALHHKANLLLARPAPITVSDEERVGKEMSAVADRIAGLNNRIAAMQATMPVSPPPYPPPAHQPPGPSAFPRAISSSGADVAAHVLQQVEGTRVEDVTTEAAVRDGTWARNRAQVFARLGLPLPNDQRTAALVGVPNYTRPGGNGLQSPAVQAHVIARGKRLW